MRWNKVIVLQSEYGFVSRITKRPLGREVWDLAWEGPVSRNRAHRMIRNAETEAPRNGGDQLVIEGGKEEEALRDLLNTWPRESFTETETGYIVNLIVPDEEGHVHEDLATARH